MSDHKTYPDWQKSIREAQEIARQKREEEKRQAEIKRNNNVLNESAKVANLLECLGLPAGLPDEVHGEGARRIDRYQFWVRYSGGWHNLVVDLLVSEEDQKLFDETGVEWWHSYQFPYEQTSDYDSLLDTTQEATAERQLVTAGYKPRNDKPETVEALKNFIAVQMDALDSAYEKAKAVAEKEREHRLLEGSASTIKQSLPSFEEPQKRIITELQKIIDERIEQAFFDRGI